MGYGNKSLPGYVIKLIYIDLFLPQKLGEILITVQQFTGDMKTLFFYVSYLKLKIKTLQ